MDELKVYTLGEVSKMLQLTRRTLYNYILSGQLKATKIGKFYRVQHKDLQELIETGSNKK